MADNEAGSGAAPINTGLIEHEIEAIEVDTTVMPPYLLYIGTV
jgi:hypothetical protein